MVPGTRVNTVIIICIRANIEATGFINNVFFFFVNEFLLLIAYKVAIAERISYIFPSKRCFWDRKIIFGKHPQFYPIISDVYELVWKAKPIHDLSFLIWFYTYSENMFWLFKVCFNNKNKAQYVNSFIKTCWNSDFLKL